MIYMTNCSVWSGFTSIYNFCFLHYSGAAVDQILPRCTGQWKRKHYVKVTRRFWGGLCYFWGFFLCYFLGFFVIFFCSVLLGFLKYLMHLLLIPKVFQRNRKETRHGSRSHPQIWVSELVSSCWMRLVRNLIRIIDLFHVHRIQ